MREEIREKLKREKIRTESLRAELTEVRGWLELCGVEGTKMWLKLHCYKLNKE